MRYVLEGEWTGYTPSQRRIVHREVISEKRANKLRVRYAIHYTDGTLLVLTVRPAKPRERVQKINAYGNLIADCEFYDVWSVDELPAARAAFRKQA